MILAMSRKHSEEIINSLKKLRKEGHSIDELVTKFSIPKSTIWHHVGHIKISEEFKRILQSRQGGSTKRKALNFKKAREKAIEILNLPNPKRELAIVIAMLYWAEGSKKVCEFINSDGKMIEVYLFIIRNIFGIEEKYIKPTMRIFSGMDKKECLDYWSKITFIPKKNFIIRLNDGGTKCRTKYGMCRITIRKGHTSLKLLLSLRDCIYEEIIKLKI